jgi:DNA recombination protein RmuC
MWAVLNTARAVLKDAATREQIPIIREHLALQGKDFGRFRKRMTALAKHIALAHQDVQQVETPAKKISSRFDQIERVDLEETPRRLGTEAKEKRTKDE